MSGQPQPTTSIDHIVDSENKHKDDDDKSNTLMQNPPHDSNPNPHSNHSPPQPSSHPPGFINLETFIQTPSQLTTTINSQLSTSRPLRLVRPTTISEGYKPPPNLKTYAKHIASAISPSTTSPSSSSLPQTMDWIYDIQYLVFSGGGVKGYTYAGAILALDKAFLKHNLNLYKQLEGAAGTSIGAMFALYVTLGIRGRQLKHEVMTKKISDTMQNMSIENLINVYGLSVPTMFRQSVFDVLERHIGNGDITFKELFDITQKHYVCCVTNVYSNMPEYHSHLTTPNYKVFESVAASMCIPLIFSPCIINGQCYVDGAFTDNCPFVVFPTDKTLIVCINSLDKCTDLSVVQNYIMRLMYNLLDTIERHNFESIPPHERRRILRIFVDEIFFMDVNLSDAMKQRLIAKGSLCMEKFIDPTLVTLDYMKICFKIVCYVVFAKFILNKH